MTFTPLEIWDYLNDEGRTTGVVNMPTMYPPRELDGFVVSGGPDAVRGRVPLDRLRLHRACAPSQTSLKTRFDYRVHPDPLLSSNDERGAEVEAILDLFDARFEAALSLFEEYDLDFLHLTLFYINVLHHFFWDDEPTRRGWQRIDKWIGRLAELEDTDLVLMSDHGSAATTTEFYINEWLAENGYQTRERTLEDYLRPLGLTRENALRLAKRAGAVDLLAKTVPERLQQLVPQQAGLKRGRKLEAIDLDRTKAVASSQGPIYLNPMYDVDSVRQALMADLQEAADDEGCLLRTSTGARTSTLVPTSLKAPKLSWISAQASTSMTASAVVEFRPNRTAGPRRTRVVAFSLPAVLIRCTRRDRPDKYSRSRAHAVSERRLRRPDGYVRRGSPDTLRQAIVGTPGTNRRRHSQWSTRSR